MTDEDAGVDTRDRARWPRRAVLAGLAGAGLTATAGVADRIAPPGASPPERDLADVRRTAERPADAAGFASRDESYARSAGPIERASAVRRPAPAPAPAPRPGPEFPTAADAAAATEVSVATILDPADPVVHLLRRTTFGPTPELVAMVHAVGIDAWLESQLAPDTIPDPEADAIWAAFPLASADPPTIRASVERARWDAMNDHSTATMARQVWSNRQLFEVMVDFWANHLNVPTPGPGGWDVGPGYQNDVIRRHALGTFSDMLVDAVRHPALLRYLTAAQSTKESVNENLGRELLELHTVGVASGYTEDDVRNSAYILTGRTVLGRDAGDDESTFRYDPDKHWVGPVTVLDFHHDNPTAEGGLEVGDAYLRHLAVHPATAQTVARKLAVRFVSDVPPPELVDRLAQAYLDNGSAVVPVLTTLFHSAEFWAAVGQKTRRPLENVAASARVLGVAPVDDARRSAIALANAAGRAGHRPLAWRAPNGYPDVHAAWRSAGGVVETWNTHRMLVGDWKDGLTRPDPAELPAGRPASTVGDYVEGLCHRLCFQAFRADHRDALVAFLGGDPAAPLSPSLDDRAAVAAIAVVLDSPYFALR